MKAFARQASRPVRRVSKRQPNKPRPAPLPPPPPNPPLVPNIHYEAGWTDSWSHRRCLHKHQRLTEAAECAMPTGAGWYVFAVENGAPRQLLDAEEKTVNRYRFSGWQRS
jgi:hypothetical protein